MRTGYKIFILGVIFFISSNSKACAEIKIKAEVDKTAITTGEVITYKLTVSSSERNLPPPEFAEFPGFTIISSLQSSNISFSGGSVKTVIAYSFVLAPAAEGRIKIAPSYIDFKNRRYESESFEIEVKKGSKPLTPGGTPKKPDTEEPLGQQQLPQYTL
jgi:hypothetical protein